MTSGTGQVRIGLLGCGRASEYLHLPTLKRLPNVELISIAETDAARRQDLSKQLDGVKICDSYTTLLEQPDIDAVVIALPNPLHAPAAIAAFEKGLHVYVEKPLATTLDEAQAILSSWRQSKKVGMVGYNYRFGEQQVEARRLIQKGELGSIVSIQSIFSSKSREIPNWKRARESGGGSLLDLASHHLDLICWLLDQRPQTISCTLNSIRSEHDNVGVQMGFANGLIAQILGSFSAGENDRIEVFGEKGKVVIDRYRSTKLATHPADLSGVRLKQFVYAAKSLSSPDYWIRKFTGAGAEKSYESALFEFADAVLTGRQPVPDILDGYRALRLAAAAERAAEDGETINFSNCANADSSD